MDRPQGVDDPWSRDDQRGTDPALPPETLRYPVDAMLDAMRATTSA